MYTPLQTLIEEKGFQVHTIGPEASVLQAVRAMNEAHIGALLVTQRGKLIGIFSERDVLARVVAERRDPSSAKVADVMTTNIAVVPPSLTVKEAMAVVTEKRCRHLPVMKGAELVGVISAGDLTRWATRDQAQTIEDLVRYITGQYPG